MKAKLTRLWSFLLALVMLVSLLPTTALAASPDASNVYVDGDKNFYNSTRLYYINGDSDGNFTGNASNYNAAYDPATGTLTLKDYNGKGIMVGGVGRTDITVKLVGTNIINDGSLENAVGGDITVTSSDGGTLSITRTLNGSNAAIGIETGLSASYTTGNVTIKGNAKVTINMTHNGTSTYEKAYGIFAKENITISENASVDITCATPNNTTGGGNCNGLYAAKDVTIDTNGTIKIDVTNAGKDKDNGYSYGVYHMRTATLTKVGNMEVQWKKEDNNTNYPGGAFTKGATFSDTDHAINVDTTNCYASYRYGTPYTVTVQNGTVTGPGVPNASGSGMFLENDTVSIKADTKTGNSGENIPFKGWTSSDVTITNPTSPSNSFTVPGKDVTVTAMHSPFYGTPVFTRTSDSSGTIAFQTVVKPDNSEFFEYVKNGETTYNGLYPQPTTTSGASPYEYSVSASTYYAGDIKYLEAGDYRMAVTLNGERYLSDPFTVDYTAAPTGNYSDSVRVYNANKKLIGLGDGECLTANDATGASSYTGGSSYVARYDKSSGTLYLKDYQGVAADGQIYAHGDLNIVVENDSSFTTSVSATNNLYGIQANGKLNISGSGKLTVTANGNGDVYGIYAKEGVTISAPLNVQVGKVDSSKNGPVYGIYTQSGAISLSGAEDKTITATGGKGLAYGVYNKAQTSSSAASNITISGKLTVSPSNGTSNYGIYTGSGSTITLDAATLSIQSGFDCGIYNNNGNVVIKNSPDVTLNSDKSGSRGIWTNYGGNLTIENSTVKVSANGLVAELNGNVSIKDSMVDLTRTSSNYEVIRTGNSSAANTIDLSGSGSVTLTAPGKQEYAMISGKVTATSGTKVEKGTYNSEWKNYKGEYDSANNKTVLKFVHESAAPTTYTVSFDANGGTGTMADVTGVSGEYTLPACGFAAPADKQFKGWATSADGTAIPGTTIDVTADTTLYAIWENIPVTEHAITVTNGKATVGAGTEISKAAEGTTVTLTANAASDGQMFDKWEVVSGSITLADATSETTTFVMPAGAVSVKATYKNAPHTHTYNQETVKPEALKTPADCTRNAVYFKSCSCGAISTTDTFVAMNTALDHAYGSDWKYDSTNHWHECSRCHEKKDNAAHGYKDGVCTVCGAKDPDYEPPVKENPFVDVSESSVYYDAILWAYYHEPQQITGGYTATEFRPGNPCTRGQVVTFLWRAAGCPEPTGDTSMFKDASSIAAPYQKAVAWAVEKGITTGYNDGTFRPNDSVTRAQFVTFLWRYENRPATSGSIAGFTDAASIAEPYQQAVAWAVEKGITTGYNDGSFRPNATCTRWAVVLFMYRDMT